MPVFQPSPYSRRTNPMWIYRGQYLDTGGDYGGPADQAVGLNSGQRANARIIEREFSAAGFGSPVVAAAIINALAESMLNNEAVGDGGSSVGLFQLHERGGGHGMSVEDRKNPTLNTRRIIDQAKKAKGFMAKVHAGVTSVPELAAAFSTYVERPADKPGNEVKRAAMVARYFPGELAALATHEVKTAPWWMWGLMVSSTLVALWGLKGVVQNRRK